MQNLFNNKQSKKGNILFKGERPTMGDEPWRSRFASPSTWVARVGSTLMPVCAVRSVGFRNIKRRKQSLCIYGEFNINETSNLYYKSYPYFAWLSTKRDDAIAHTAAWLDATSAVGSTQLCYQLYLCRSLFPCTETAGVGGQRPVYGWVGGRWDECRAGQDKSENVWVRWGGTRMREKKKSR